jgi:hypothetical protein
VYEGLSRCWVSAVGKMPISISVLAAADGLLSTDQPLLEGISAPCQVM